MYEIKLMMYNPQSVSVHAVRYYPDGEPWMEPTGTNRYTFGGKERVNLGGLNPYDFGPLEVEKATSQKNRQRRCRNPKKICNFADRLCPINMRHRSTELFLAEPPVRETAPTNY